MRILFGPAGSAGLGNEEGILYTKKLDLEAARQAFVEARAFVSNVEPYDLEAIGQGLFRIGEQSTSNGKVS